MWGLFGPRVIPWILLQSMLFCSMMESSLNARTNRQGDRGQPCQIPLCGRKASVGSPLTRTEMVIVDMHAQINEMKWLVNPCLLRASVMKFHSILSKALARSSFSKKSLLFPRFKVKGVDDFLSYDNVRSNVSSLNKSSLTRVDDTWKVMFDSISERFGNYFIAYIAKAYRAKIFRSSW